MNFTLSFDSDSSSYMKINNVLWYIILSWLQKASKKIYMLFYLPLAGILPLDSPCSGLCDVIDTDEHFLGRLLYTHTGQPHMHVVL